MLFILHRQSVFVFFALHKSPGNKFPHPQSSKLSGVIRWIDIQPECQSHQRPVFRLDYLSFAERADNDVCGTPMRKKFAFQPSSNSFKCLFSEHFEKYLVFYRECSISKRLLILIDACFKLIEIYSGKAFFIGKVKSLI